jgi:hypothetical protein
MDNEQGLPNHLPTYATDLVEQLEKLNPPVVVESPLDAADIPAISFMAGRRSIVDELTRLLNVSPDT